MTIKHHNQIEIDYGKWNVFYQDSELHIKDKESELSRLLEANILEIEDLAIILEKIVAEKAGI